MSSADIYDYVWWPKILVNISMSVIGQYALVVKVHTVCSQIWSLFSTLPFIDPS